MFNVLKLSSKCESQLFILPLNVTLWVCVSKVLLSGWQGYLMQIWWAMCQLCGTGLLTAQVAAQPAPVSWNQPSCGAAPKLDCCVSLCHSHPVAMKCMHSLRPTEKDNCRTCPDGKVVCLRKIISSKEQFEPHLTWIGVHNAVHSWLTYYHWVTTVFCCNSLLNAPNLMDSTTTWFYP